MLVSSEFVGCNEQRPIGSSGSLCPRIRIHLHFLVGKHLDYVFIRRYLWIMSIKCS